jgi:hypothetical protein
MPLILLLLATPLHGVHWPIIPRTITIFRCQLRGLMVAFAGSRALHLMLIEAGRAHAITACVRAILVLRHSRLGSGAIGVLSLPQEKPGGAEEQRNASYGADYDAGDRTAGEAG